MPGLPGGGLQWRGVDAGHMGRPKNKCKPCRNALVVHCDLIDIHTHNSKRRCFVTFDKRSI